MAVGAGVSEQDQVFTKCAWRLIPFMGLLYLVNFIDRSNVSYAALTMNKQLGFSPSVFGFGAGIFFMGYALFQVPANVILERIGARRWVFCILAVWGLLSASTALVHSPTSFYLLRFFLGIAEAGFAPGMFLYLTYWFPRGHLARFTSYFMVAIPLSYVIGGPLSTLVLKMDGLAGIHGWQWMFLIEGLPAFLLSFVTLKLLPDRPKDAPWLNTDEKKTIAERCSAGEPQGQPDLWSALRDPRLFALGLASFTFQAAAYGLALWAPQILQAMDFSNLAIGFIIALLFVGGIPAMILVGRSSSIRGERIWHVALPFLLAASGVVLVSLAHSHIIVLGALALAVISNFAAYGPFFTLPSSFLRGTALAGGIGLFSTLGSFGGFFGPSIMGVLRQASGAYTSSLLAVALGYVLAALIVIGVGRALASRRGDVGPSG